MGLRRNILSMPLADVQRLTSAFNVLKADGSYNALIERHMRAMMLETPQGSSRNAAHRGPAFLPWHRAALVELAAALRAVDPLIDDLPYWRWEEDAARFGNAARSPLWTANYLGPDGTASQGNRVLTGPFAAWRARLYDAGADTFFDRAQPGLIRRLGRDPEGIGSLPTAAQVDSALSGFGTYDVAPWNDAGGTRSFRNRVEGFFNGPALHNRVHLYVGGDMLTGTSPNDPAFWFNHCNVDRIWWAWQQRYGINTYRPTSGGPAGHNLNDQLRFLLGTWTPANVLDIANLGYTYA